MAQDFPIPKSPQWDTMMKAEMEQPVFSPTSRITQRVTGHIVPHLTKN